MTRKQHLIDILSIQTTSGNEFDMIAYIHDFCSALPNVKSRIKDNNVYVTKGKSTSYPCMVSHTDTVHSIHKHFSVHEVNDQIFAYSTDDMQQVGVGGDDKVGIWLCLQMLMSVDVIKCAFFHSEEIGCVGSRAADMSFFNDVSYCLQGDRRGNKDFVHSISGQLYSDDFAKAVAPIIKQYGYQETTGAITDVGQLAENGIGVSVANMSCGYYNPHSDSEVVVYPDADKCLDMCIHIFTTLGNKKFPHEYTTKRYDFSKYNFDWHYEDDINYTSEIVVDDDNHLMCYYCNNKHLEESEFGQEFMYCKECNSDLHFYEEEVSEMLEYNDSFRNFEVVNKFLTKENEDA